MSFLGVVPPVTCPSVLESLRATLRAIEGDGHRRRAVLPFGAEAIDSRLTDGGLRLDALHEVAAATPALGPQPPFLAIWTITPTIGAEFEVQITVCRGRQG